MYELIDSSDSSYDRDKYKDKIFEYKKRVIFIQGLIERTTIFGENRDINLSYPETYEGKLKFLYDGTLALPNGRLLWRDWIKENTKHLRLGSRIVYAGVRGYNYKEIASSLFPYNYRNCGKYPSKGIYNIDSIEVDYNYYGHGTNISTKKKWKEFQDKEVKNKKYICHFNPGDKIYSNNYWLHGEHERKNSIPFYIHDSEYSIINFDVATSEDFEYYLNNRIDRENYLDMLPLLIELKKLKKEEELWENNFIEFVRSRIESENTEKVIELIKEGIKWWKFRVTQVRALKKEDAKAVRMIQKYVEVRVKK